jgi:putative transposase
MWKVPEAFCGEQLAVRPRQPDGLYSVCFGAYEVATIDLTKLKCVGDVPGQVSAMSSG